MRPIESNGCFDLTCSSHLVRVLECIVRHMTMESVMLPIGISGGHNEGAHDQDYTLLYCFGVPWLELHSGGVTSVCLSGWGRGSDRDIRLRLVAKSLGFTLADQQDAAVIYYVWVVRAKLPYRPEIKGRESYATILRVAT